VSPSAGWSAGASYLVDVLSAASPDIVSMASPAYRETRHAASVNGGYKVGVAQLDAHGNLSSEPDYLSQSAGGAVAIELNDKLITPRVGYDLARDRIGIRNTPFSQLSRRLTTHTIEAGITFVLAADTLLVTGVYLGLERGEQSKLYRYVPFFDRADLPRIAPGISARDVNDLRLPVRPRETVPRERDRVAAGARVNHRMSMGTLRVEERLYIDTWGIKATTTDARYMHDLGDHLRVSPHVRYHLQSGASFYRLAYTPLSGDRTTGYVLPAFRTTDREWSPMMAVSSGLDTRVALTSEKAAVRYAILLGGEVMYTWYFDSLFVENRTAVYATVGFEVEL
jgi:hypothetical protein